MIRILLVEDHAAFRQPLAFMLGQEPGLTVVGEVGTLAAARPLLGEADVAVIDLQLPDGNGIDLVRELRETNPNASAVILTADNSRQQLARAIEAGAMGGLHKSNGIREVIDSVRRVANGESLLTAVEMIELLRLASQERESHRQAAASFARLTPREWDVLQAIADGLNDKEIAQRYHVSTETVRTHVVNLLSKLDVDSRLKALVFAVRHGAVNIA